MHPLNEDVVWGGNFLRLHSKPLVLFTTNNKHTSHNAEPNMAAPLAYPSADRQVVGLVSYGVCDY